MKWLLSKDDIGAIVNRRLAPLVSVPATQIVLSDRDYRTVSMNWFTERIRADEMLTGTYVPEVFDCDDLVLYLRSRTSLYAVRHQFDAPLALGLIFTDQHAFNFCIDDEQEFTLIDTARFHSRGSCRVVEDFPAFLELAPGQNAIKLVLL